MAYRVMNTRLSHRLSDYVNSNFVLPTSSGKLAGLGQGGGISGSTLALVAAGAAAVWYFFLRKK